jgi:hypothetical protein
MLAEMKPAPIIDFDSSMLVVPFIDHAVWIAPAAADSARKSGFAADTPCQWKAGQDIVGWRMANDP